MHSKWKLLTIHFALFSALCPDLTCLLRLLFVRFQIVSVLLFYRVLPQWFPHQWCLSQMIWMLTPQENLQLQLSAEQGLLWSWAVRGQTHSQACLFVDPLAMSLGWWRHQGAWLCLGLFHSGRNKEVWSSKFKDIKATSYVSFWWTPVHILTLTREVWFCCPVSIALANYCSICVFITAVDHVGTNIVGSIIPGSGGEQDSSWLWTNTCVTKHENRGEIATSDEWALTEVKVMAITTDILYDSTQTLTSIATLQGIPTDRTCTSGHKPAPPVDCAM